MKIGIAQINTTVGDLAGNKTLILNAYQALVAEGSELIVFPELAVCGYPPRDLLFKSRFVSDIEATLKSIAAEIGSVPAVIGTVEARPVAAAGRPFYNAAAWCENGAVQTMARKCLLPSYDVFDEDRYFEPAVSPVIHEWNGKRIGLTICEDIWTAPSVPTNRRYNVDPLTHFAEHGIDLLLNLSASPWHEGKNEAREPLLQFAADRCNCTAVYCNAVGGNDELIFDGGSLVAHPVRGLIAGLAAFRDENRMIDIDAPASFVVSEHFNLKGNAATHDALVLGLRDYAQKSGFKKALIGLSGGIDSAVVAVLAAEAFGPENVIGIALPSAISSQHSRDDAAALAKNLGIQYHEVAIADTVSAAEVALSPLFEGLPADVTEENIQARARGVLLMAMSNKFGALLLTTGNKSEISVGYCTLYGDMCGGLAVISDLPKMKVYALARHMNLEREVIPVNTIDKAPSAELRPDQKDEDSLPPYPVLDGILRLYVEEGLSRAEIVERGYKKDVVDDIVRKVDLNEYKRKQAAPGLKTTPLAFGVGRRIPIVQKYIG
ncbi:MULTISPECIES: NAD+ synthase [unclassified Lentimonas]|uniref:NAD+ synthase n=1 Tax=unclassified Lentimonas TaxID=2630993 RepID=UPI001321F5F9|nr:MULTISPECIES: NAD+ synthase [unclassified Lentimonas]CAA6678415.1 NAD synthetase (EC / Glutamine amidotransferase chain of NAD synthetase [Lentimonas sp. CC4]CAA6685507.1 NAD synthetase (EC / Glutamine amidotransferase chain of NAD synthetase [Lentimonas sp. CC6]CAA7076955.1 NAD synthetase (EC / Glutamine amidotransferase chain of NAD synthetase [Lentimonas sp. CC4]CAA7170506.1 NAD synthetase (EC / Glutamine amidotransferase chain of NAD synthetase [Lentimonas sp. CC21]CAA7179797.1 NAD synt